MWKEAMKYRILGDDIQLMEILLERKRWCNWKPGP